MPEPYLGMPESYFGLFQSYLGLPGPYLGLPNLPWPLPGPYLSLPGPYLGLPGSNVILAFLRNLGIPEYYFGLSAEHLGVTHPQSHIQLLESTVMLFSQTNNSID